MTHTPDGKLHDISPEQASQQLRQAESARIVTDRDRRVHGWSMTGFGILLGAWVSLSAWAQDRSALSNAAVGVLAAGMLALVAWQAQASTTPRHVKRLSAIATAVTLVVTLASITLVNGYTAWLTHDRGVTSWGPVHIAVILAAGALSALPMVIVGARIMRDER